VRTLSIKQRDISMRQVRMVALAALSAALLGALPLQAQDKGKGVTKKAATTSSTSSASGGQCIAPAIMTTVEECPANAPKFEKGTTMLGKAQAPRSNLSTSERKKDKPGDRKLGPSVEIDAATLRNRAPSRCAPRSCSSARSRC
jgi:hypothetical protein